MRYLTLAPAIPGQFTPLLHSLSLLPNELAEARSLNVQGEAAAADVLVLNVSQVTSDRWQALINNEVGRSALVGRTLVLDCCTEGPVGGPHATSVNAIAHSLGDQTRVVYVTQNEAAVVTINSSAPPNVAAAYFHYFLHTILRTANTAFQSTGDIDNYLVRRWADEESAEARLFGCPMSNPRPHRLLVLGWLSRRSLLAHGFVSLHGRTHDPAFTVEALSKAHDLYPDFRDDLDEAERLVVGLPYKNFSEREDVNMLSTFRTPPYGQAPIGLVAESEMSSGQQRRITEKTIKALVAGQALFVLGNPSALTDLVRQGFVVDVDGLDLTYDIVEDPQERLALALRNFESLVSMPPRQFMEWRLASRVARSENVRRFQQIANAMLGTWVDALITAVTGPAGECESSHR